MRAPAVTINNARRLRRQLSAPEARLWIRLRERALGRPVFRRQHPIVPYVLDFYCAKPRLAIEIDGLSHDMGDRPRARPISCTTATRRPTHSLAWTPDLSAASAPA